MVLYVILLGTIEIAKSLERTSLTRVRELRSGLGCRLFARVAMRNDDGMVGCDVDIAIKINPGILKSIVSRTRVFPKSVC